MFTAPSFIATKIKKKVKLHVVCYTCSVYDIHCNTNSVVRTMQLLNSLRHSVSGSLSDSVSNSVSDSVSNSVSDSVSGLTE